MSEIFPHKAIDMRLLDYFAVHAPESSMVDIEREQALDATKARHDDKYIAKEDMQIKCELRYKWAKMMIKAR